MPPQSRVTQSNHALPDPNTMSQCDLSLSTYITMHTLAQILCRCPVPPSIFGEGEGPERRSHCKKSRTSHIHQMISNSVSGGLLWLRLSRLLVAAAAVVVISMVALVVVVVVVVAAALWTSALLQLLLLLLLPPPTCGQSPAAARVCSGCLGEAQSVACALSADKELFDPVCD